MLVPANCRCQRRRSGWSRYRSFLPASPPMTIAGVTSHLRSTEWGWFARSFPSRADGAMPPTGDPSGWTFEKRPLQALVAEYEEECERSSRIVAGLDLDQLQEYTPVGLLPVRLRWIVGHMIEETARHLGHLDILREMTDGTRSY